MRHQICSILLCLAACLALQTSSLAQQTIPLAFKFGAGDVVHYDVSISGSASLMVTGQKVTPVSIRGAISLIQSVAQAFPDGSGRIETRIPSGELTMTLDKEQVKLIYANNQVRWYANGKESTPPQGDLSKVPLIGTPLVYTMMPDGRVKDVAIADPALISQVTRSLPKFDFAAMQSMGGGVFPAAPVAVGETWRNTTRIAPIGPQYPVTVSTSRTLDSYTDAGGIGLSKIVGFAETRFGGMPAIPLPGQDVSIAISDIRHTINSTEFFNTTSGRLMRGDYDIAFSTQLSAQAGGEQKAAGIEARLRLNVQSR